MPGQSVDCGCSPPSTPDQLRSARHDRLRYVHSKAVDLVQFESKSILDRTNSYLVTTSFLLGAYGVALAARSPLALMLPFLGLLITSAQPFLVARTISALEYWRSTAALVESDDDYWYPGKVVGVGDSATSFRNDSDLDLLTARQRKLSGESVRQDAKSMERGRLPGFIMRRHARFPAPNRVFGIHIPLLVSILWLLALGAAATQFASPVGKDRIIVVQAPISVPLSQSPGGTSTTSSNPVGSSTTTSQSPGSSATSLGPTVTGSQTTSTP